MSFGIKNLSKTSKLAKGCGYLILLRNSTIVNYNLIFGRLHLYICTTNKKFKYDIKNESISTN